MKRYLKPFILQDLPHKIVLLMGPRQCGKTTLAKQLNDHYDYLNFDSSQDRLLLLKKAWDRTKALIIFDELHKMKQWKRWLKGVYDTEGLIPALLVTGSARLDTYRKVGDSLAGRYFQFQLHPIDLKEANTMALPGSFDRLWTCSGFPEPFLQGNSTFYRRWRMTHSDIILRQDLMDITAIRDIKGVESLQLLLQERISSEIVYANLAQDLERDGKTIKRWLQALENLYLCYSVTPYSRRMTRSLLKAPKYYFYDHVRAELPGPRLENMVANALLKELHFIRDTQGLKTKLHYLKTKDGKELDFCVVIEGQVTHLIEVKWSDEAPSPAFDYFSQFYPAAKKIQLVKNLQREKTYPNGIEIRDVVSWLTHLDFQFFE